MAYTYKDYLYDLYKTGAFLLLEVNNDFIKDAFKYFTPKGEELHVGPIKGKNLNEAFELKGLFSFEDNRDYYYVRFDELKPSSIPDFYYNYSPDLGAVYFNEEMDRRYKLCNGKLPEWRKRIYG